MVRGMIEAEPDVPHELIITEKEYNKFWDDQIGKPCEIHGTIIKKGKYGNWCGQRTKYGTWCVGNLYPRPENTNLIIKESQ